MRLIGPQALDHAAGERSATHRVTTQTATAHAPTGPFINGCVRGAHPIHFRAQGEKLSGAVVGAGPTGVVLANQSDNNACQWPPFPAYLASHGMRVLAFDYGNGDPGAEVRAAACLLRARGARRLVLIGASVGGAVVIHTCTPGGRGGEPVGRARGHLYPFPADARRLRTPSFQIGATENQLTQSGRVTRALFRESPSTASACY